MHVVRLLLRNYHSGLHSSVDDVLFLLSVSMNGNLRIIKKQPWYISLRSGELMVFAGIWDTWTPKEGDVVESCCIITTQANSFVEAIHNRMPVILNSEQWTIWLSQQAHSPDKLLPLTYSQVVKSM